MIRDLTARAAAARDAFDRGFAEPPPGTTAATADLLAIRVDGAPYALRIGELRELAACPRIVTVPSTAPALLGLVGLRGELVPLFSLAALLGRGGAPPPRWLVVCAGPAAVAVGFDGLDGHLRVPADDVRDAICVDGVTRAVIALASMIGSMGGHT